MIIRITQKLQPWISVQNLMPENVILRKNNNNNTIALQSCELSKVVQMEDNHKGLSSILTTIKLI